MAKKDINKSKFDNGTHLKLDIFRECFRAWFPVLANDKYTEKIFVYDLFAGSGTDAHGDYGSPLVLLDEAKGDKKQFCNFVNNKDKEITFIFNEKEVDKAEALKKGIITYFEDCQSDCEFSKCAYKAKVEVKNDTFINVFQSSSFENVLKDRRVGKFVLLDQYGYKEISDEIFLKLVAYPKTDFIFFIASNYVKRFKSLPAVTDYFQKIGSTNFNESEPKECHRIIADYFRQLMPPNKEYYLHHFSYLKKTNYYGLIFGTNHTYGMEKFLSVCWSHDRLSGESTENMYNDFEVGSLFYNPGNSNKKQEIKHLVEEEILNLRIKTNVEGFKFVLSKGCQTSLYLECIEDLINSKRVSIDGKFNKKVTSIHQLKGDKIYTINVLSQ
ncbi:MAG: three-Cys-motif partner protein TcmP [Bacteroidota bacterium]|jgi:three-Cys-motif partner protein